MTSFNLITSLKVLSPDIVHSEVMGLEFQYMNIEGTQMMSIKELIIPIANNKYASPFLFIYHRKRC